jgi:RHS repeat-associated protein
MYYDYKGQLIQRKETNHLDGLEKEYFAYTFTGNVSKKKHVHSALGMAAQTEVYTYSYDHADRLTETKHKLNNNAEISLAKNTYDELGRLKINQAANYDILNTSYNYTIRSQISRIGCGYFSDNLTYTYGGNIASKQWWQYDREDGQYNQKKYTFNYDGLSRLLSAQYQSSQGTVNLQVGYQYDKHGNITRISRFGMTSPGNYGNIDQLVLSYGNTNQLQNVNDASMNIISSNSMDFKDYTKGNGIEYTYNANGATTKDLNKGISLIKYNSINLPQTIEIVSPVAEARKSYTYSARGEKLKVVQNWNPYYSTTPIIGTQVCDECIYRSQVTDYIKNKVYENYGLKRILFDNGYYENGTYYFYFRDRLGNNRAVTNQHSALMQSTEYYPFGMSVASGIAEGQQPYKYGGKELDLMHGLNLYDSQARWYDPVVGRFTTPDPLAEKYYSISPYAYCANNPINAVDLRGDSITFTLGLNTYYYGMDSNGNYGFLDQNGNIYNDGNDDSVLSILTNSLNQLRSNPVGENLIDYLSSHTNSINIQGYSKDGLTSDNKSLMWNPLGRNAITYTESGIERGNSLMSLGHELAHVKNLWQTGSLDMTEHALGLTGAEKYATHIENKLRAENGFPLRTYYGTVEVKASNDVMIVPYGTSLITKDRKSVFYWDTKSSNLYQY